MSILGIGQIKYKISTAVLAFLVLGIPNGLQADHNSSNSSHHHHNKCGDITEYHLDWPIGPPGTQEITYSPDNPDFFWISSPTHDAIAKMKLNGEAKFYAMPPDSAPHGLAFDGEGRLWVTLQNLGQVVRVNSKGKIVQVVDVNIYEDHSVINPVPHALAATLNGERLWFTGLNTGTVGKINFKKGTVKHFPLPTPNSLPVYIAAGADHNMWASEFSGNNIARITQKGDIKEFPIPTPDSHPVGVAASPDGKGMWFTEESGNKIGRITFHGKITEFPVPMTQSNIILAVLAFDYCGNLWTQAYVDPKNPLPTGHDFIIKFDRSILKAKNGDISDIPITYYQTPTDATTLHRIIQGPDKNMWFTELSQDNVGKLINNRKSCHYSCGGESTDEK